MAKDQEILIKIKADSDKATKDIQRLTKQVQTLSKTSKTSAKQVNTLSKSFAGLGKNLATVAGGFAVFSGVTSAVDTIVTFESSIKRLGAVSRASAEDLKLMEDYAIELGESTRYSASQASDAMNFLAMAGFETQEILSAVPDTLNLATVGSLDLATASDIASDSLTAFGLEADDMGRIADVMATTITSSNTTVEKLGESFKKVAPIAKKLNVSVEETSATLGVLADAGIKAEIAGTHLKIALTRIATDSGAQDRIKKLGSSVYDAQGNFRGLSTILSEISPKFKQLSEEAQANALVDIFGKNAIASGTALLGKIDTVVERTKVLNESNGNAQKIAEEMNDSIAGAFDQVTSALEGLILKSRGEMTPALKELADETSAWIRSIDADTVNSFAIGVTSLIDAFKGLGSIIGYLNDIALPDIIFGEDAGLFDTVIDGLGRLGTEVDLYHNASKRAQDQVEKFTEKLEEQNKVYTELLLSDDATIESIEKQQKANKELVKEIDKKILALLEEKLKMEQLGISTKNHERLIADLRKENSGLLVQYQNLSEARKTAKTAIEDLTEAQKKELEGTVEGASALADANEAHKLAFEERKEIELGYWENRLTVVDAGLKELEKMEKDYTSTLKSEEKERENATRDRVSQASAMSQAIIGLFKNEALERSEIIRFQREIADMQSKADEARLAGDYKTAQAYYDASRDLITEYSKHKEKSVYKDRDLTQDALRLLDAQKIKEQELATERKASADKAVESTKIKLEATQKEKATMEDLKTKIQEISKALEDSSGKFEIDTETANQKLKELYDKTAEPILATLDLDDKKVIEALDKISKEAEVEGTLNVDTQPALDSVASAKEIIEQPTDSEHTVVPDVTSAIRAIQNLEQNTSSTHTVYVRTVQQNASGGEVGFSGVPRFATGGYFKKRKGKIAGHDLTGRDDVPSLLTRGEFIQNVKAVDYYGKNFMDALNKRLIPKNALPKFATGGSVGGDQTSTSGTNFTRPINLTIDQKTFQVMSDNEVANALEKYLRKNQ